MVSVSISILPKNDPATEQQQQQRQRQQQKKHRQKKKEFSEENQIKQKQWQSFQ